MKLCEIAPTRINIQCPASVALTSNVAIPRVHQEFPSVNTRTESSVLPRGRLPLVPPGGDCSGYGARQPTAYDGFVFVGTFEQYNFLSVSSVVNDARWSLTGASNAIQRTGQTPANPISFIAIPAVDNP